MSGRLFKLHTTTSEQVRGLFGVATAFYGVTEVQARNALHAHLVLWVRAMDPKLIHKIVHDDQLRARLIGMVDSVVTASSRDFESAYTNCTRSFIDRSTTQQVTLKPWIPPPKVCVVPH